MPRMVESPSVRRITVELADQARHPSSHFVAGPVANDIFDWHFTLKGPSDTPFQEGLYHGRLILPVQYPHKPPKFIMLTVTITQPNGRFETNKEICMSMSSYHPDTWQPAWTSNSHVVRTMLEGLVSFLPEDNASGIGAINSSPEARRKYAEASSAWRCSDCGLSNSDLWAAHILKLQPQDPIPEEEKASSPVVEEIKRDEECQTQPLQPPSEPSLHSQPSQVSSDQTDTEVVTLPDGERVIYPSEAEIRAFVSKNNMQVVVLDVGIGILTAVLIWYLYYSF